ncbi:hypothetical protein KJ835_03735, partial [Patescibacteria group bacterium]|nr:hypothetical protein [Patescibacteria group bacterium]
VSTNVTGIIRSLHRYGNSTTIAQLGKGDMQIIEMNIPPKSRLIEEKARIPNATIITIYRKNEIIIPDETTVFKKNDTVIAIVKTENLQAVATIIAGK